MTFCGHTQQQDYISANELPECIITHTNVGNHTLEMWHSEGSPDLLSSELQQGNG